MLAAQGTVASGATPTSAAAGTCAALCRPLCRSLSTPSAVQQTYDCPAGLLPCYSAATPLRSPRLRSLCHALVSGCVVDLEFRVEAFREGVKGAFLHLPRVCSGRGGQGAAGTRRCRMPGIIPGRMPARYTCIGAACRGHGSDPLRRPARGEQLPSPPCRHAPLFSVASARPPSLHAPLSQYGGTTGGGSGWPSSAASALRTLSRPPEETTPAREGSSSTEFSSAFLHRASEMQGRQPGGQ